MSVVKNKKTEKQTTVKDLNPAAYNPRKISDKQLAILGKALKEYGDLGGIVYNCRTGRLIGGNQRSKALPKDSVIEKETLPVPDRTGTIAHGYIIVNSVRFSYREVDWDETREKAANIAANKHGGDWDMEALEDILKELAATEMDFDFELTGFDEDELNRMLESVSPMYKAYERTGGGLQGYNESESAPRQKFPLTFIFNQAEYEAWEAVKKQAGLRDDKVMLLQLIGGVKC